MTDQVPLDPTQDVAADLDVDRLVHEPARLGILSVLDGCEEADFQFLQTVLGLTKGNLSSHLSKLEAAGLVEVTKTVDGRTPRTMLRITRDGHDGLRRHWEQMEAIRRLSTGPRRRWAPVTRPATRWAT